MKRFIIENRMYLSIAGYVVFFCMLAVCLIGCTSIAKKIDEDMQKGIETVWKQKDCRAGIAAALTEIRPASLQAKSSAAAMVRMAKPDSPDFQKCYFYATNFNWEVYALDDFKDQVLPDIYKILGLIK